MNNHWGTNYRAYQEGIITFRYALWPHMKYDAYKNSQLAIGLSQPLLVKPATGPKSMLSGIYPDQPQVIVTAFKPCDYGNGRMLTLFNSSELPVETKLISPGNPGFQVWQSNSGEDKTLPVSNLMKIPAWGTVIIRVE
jgi:alpha-mannosidase